MFGPIPTRDSLIETLNYSLQTITTVGYGNWVPAGWDLKEPFMFVGGALFAVLIGILSNFLSHR